MSETVRVLLVEDNPGDARLVEFMLARVPEIDFVLEDVSTLEAALRRLRQEGVDVVLLDLSLPDSEARDSFRALHAANPEVPIVAVTGRQDRELAVAVVRDGAHDVLSKRALDTDRLSRALLFARERCRWLDTMRHREERYSLAFAGSDDGLWDWDLDSNRLYLSARWKDLLGYAESEIGTDVNEWLDRVHPVDRRRVEQAIEDHRAGLTPSLRIEHRLRQHSGHFRWMLARGRAVRDAAGAARRVVGSLSDVHERKLSEERLRHGTLRDRLTGLANATLLNDRVAISIAHLERRPSYQFALLYLDLDHFERVNETFGRAAGDELLAAVARRIEGVLRPNDTLALVEGDEFAILADDLDEPRHAKRLAERIEREMLVPFEIRERRIACSASVGITLSRKGYRHPEEVLRDAESAMHRAKAQGRGQHLIFDRDMHRDAVEHLQLESELRRAVEREEFRLHYQPIVSLLSGKIEGFEALLRWQHPRRGLIYPDEFLPLAEETGLIVPMGSLALEEACRQMATWLHRYRNGPLEMSVNLSPRQFLEESLPDSVDRILAATSLPPECLRFEIAERPLAENVDLARQRLAQLAQRRVRISIEDFGVGYSLLCDLHQLPADAIKIDRSVLSRVRAEGEWGVVETLVEVARFLGLRATAEGLETEEQVARLRALHCESVQGYYFSAPLDGAGAEALLAGQAT